MTAVEARVDSHPALGHHETMASELEALVTEHPLRERFWCQLMLSLYRSDRRSDGLAAAQRLRSVLVDELGIDPSVEARAFESQMPSDDPELELQSPGPPNALPTPLTSFVGRDRQRREVGKLLREHRLITLLGPGGLGKTRLAIAVSDEALAEFAGGVWWVDATYAAGAGSVAAELANVIGVAVPPGMAVADALQRYLSSRTVLVVVDNAERIAEDLSRWLGDLVEAAPGLTVLVTSRVPLKVLGEQRYPVPPLELPGDDVEIARETEAMRLFLERLEARGGHDPPGALAFVRGVGRAWFVWGDLADVRDRLIELQRLVEPHEAADPEELAWLHLRTAWPLFLTGEIVGGMAEMAAAAERFGEVDRRIGLAHAHAGQGHLALFVEGPTDAALGFYQQAIAESRRCGSAETVGWILAQAAQALIMADRADAEVDRMLFDELMAPAREALGSRWDEEVAAGALLTVEEALELGPQPTHNSESGILRVSPSP